MSSDIDKTFMKIGKNRAH